MRSETDLPIRKQFVSRDWVGPALVLIAAVSATAVIWILADQNRALKAALAERQTTSRDLTPGEQIPNLQLQSALDQEKQPLDSLLRDGTAVVGLMTTELFANVVDRWICSGGVFASDQVNSIDECGALEYEGSEVRSVDAAPSLLCHLQELECHRQRLGA